MGGWDRTRREDAAVRTVERELVSAGIDLRRPLESEWDFIGPGNGLIKVTGTLLPDALTALRAWLREHKPNRVRWAGLVHPVRRPLGIPTRRFPLYLSIPLDEAAALLARLEFLENEKRRWLDAEPEDHA
jgi:hypothetical protein